jgi:hypothetical protein
MNSRALFALLALAPASLAIFMRPEWVPVDRLIANTERYAAAHPSEAATQYTLGRLHYLAFVLKMDRVPAYQRDPERLPAPVRDTHIGLPLAAAREARAQELAAQELGTGASPQRLAQAIANQRRKLEAENWRPPEMPATRLVAHAGQAAEAFRKAMTLDTQDGLHPLGLASLLVQFADWRDEAKPDGLPESLQGDLRTQARRLFLQAWQLAHPAELKAPTKPIGGLSDFVSFEAGRAFLQLASETQALPAEEKDAIPKVQAAIEKLEKLPPGPITPLVLSLAPKATLAEMLAPEAAVEFDLRGLGGRERWTWVRPELGLLVWDPLDRRTITSGRQLFGNATWHIIWPDGYAALRTLDDDGDGQLTGPELAGLALWHDRDGDGHSTRAEVTPLFATGITALACTATTQDGGHLKNPRGATLQDARTLPTWDWLAQPATAHP